MFIYKMRYLDISTDYHKVFKVNRDSFYID